MSAGHMPAYPAGDYSCGTSGLTKRELFAAMAMQGILANPSEQMSRWDEERVAFSAMEHADALLAALALAEPPA